MPEDIGQHDSQPKRNFWENQIERWQQSGLSQRAYCHNNHLKPDQFYYWRRRILAPRPEVSFLPVALSDDPTVMMAMLFTVEQRMLFKGSYPLLSCFDIVTILKFLLPRRTVTLEEVIRQLEVRHKRRQASIDYAYHKQRVLEFSESTAN